MKLSHTNPDTTLRGLECNSEIKKVVYLKKSIKVYHKPMSERSLNEFIGRTGLDYNFSDYKVRFNYILFKY
jgi:hypothetical protein